MITFTRANSGTYNEETGVWTGPPTTTTLTGNVIAVSPNYKRFEALGLVVSTHQTFFFMPSIYGQRSQTDDFVKAGDTVTWNGQTYAVKDVETIGPDGIVVAARIVVAI